MGSSNSVNPNQKLQEDASPEKDEVYSEKRGVVARML